MSQREYTPEERIWAATQFNEGHLTGAQIAAQLNMTHKSAKKIIYKWAKKQREEGDQSLKKSVRGRGKLEDNPEKVKEIKEILREYYLNGYSKSSLAEMKGITRPTLHNWIQRFGQQVKEELLSEGRTIMPEACHPGQRPQSYNQTSAQINKKAAQFSEENKACRKRRNEREKKSLSLEDNSNSGVFTPENSRNQIPDLKDEMDLKSNASLTKSDNWRIPKTEENDFWSQAKEEESKSGGSRYFHSAFESCQVFSKPEIQSDILCSGKEIQSRIIESPPVIGGNFNKESGNWSSQLWSRSDSGVKYIERRQILEDGAFTGRRPVLKRKRNYEFLNSAAEDFSPFKPFYNGEKEEGQMSRKKSFSDLENRIIEALQDGRSVSYLAEKLQIGEKEIQSFIRDYEKEHGSVYEILDAAEQEVRDREIDALSAEELRAQLKAAEREKRKLKEARKEEIQKLKSENRELKAKNKESSREIEQIKETLHKKEVLIVAQKKTANYIKSLLKECQISSEPHSKEKQKASKPDKSPG